MNLSFIGAGVMAEAIIAGIRTAQLEVEIWISETVAERARFLEGKYGVYVADSNAQAVSVSELTVLAIKPQQLSEVADELRGDVSGATFMSILAGVQVKTIVDNLGTKSVIRVMPNMPAQIGMGATAWTASPSVASQTRDFAAAILASVGEQIYFDDEKLVDIATALSASGPAYVFVFAEALVDGAVELGMSPADARKLAIQMILGSAALAKDSGKHPAELRNMVTSPGGTAAAALHALETGGFRNTSIEAVLAAYRRGEELAKLADR